MKKSAKLEQKIDKLGLQFIQRHIFICADRNKCKCACAEQMEASWKFLKSRLKALGLNGRGGVARSRTQCLGVCCEGPIVVVYPEGTWYGGCDENVLEKIIQRHLRRGEVVEEHVIAHSRALNT